MCVKYLVIVYKPSHAQEPMNPFGHDRKTWSEEVTKQARNAVNMNMISSEYVSKDWRWKKNLFIHNKC